jgi:hypothetical protein
MPSSLIAVIAATIVLAGCTSAPPGAVPAATELATSVPTAEEVTAAATSGHLPHVDWLAYHDDQGRFSIQRPLTWQQSDSGSGQVEFVLPVAPGTTLVEKIMQIDVTVDATDCRESRYDGEATSSQKIAINGVRFLKEAGAGLGAGNIYEWTGYSTMKGSTCITITFVLHSANPGVYSTPPPAFDAVAESEIFNQMLDTLRFDP